MEQPDKSHHMRYFINALQLTENSVFTGALFGLERSDDEGFQWNDFFSPTMESCGTPGAFTAPLSTSFNTVCRIWETGNDPNSTDSVIFLPDSSMAIGDTAFTVGFSLSNPLWEVLTSPITGQRFAQN